MARNGSWNGPPTTTPRSPTSPSALAETAILASDIAGRLSSYLSDLDVDGGRDLEAVQERRAELGALVRKYGPTLDDTIDHLETGSDRLLELDNDTDRIEQLRVEVQERRRPGRRPRRTSSPGCAPCTAPSWRSRSARNCRRWPCRTRA